MTDFVMRDNVLLAALCVLLLLVPSEALATIFACPQTGEPDLFTDHNGPGCRPIEGKPPISIAPPSPPSTVIPPTVYKSGPRASTTQKKPSLSHEPFDTVQTKVTTLNYYGGHGAAYIPKAGEVSFEEISVRYLAAGSGPKIITETVFDGSAARSLYLAVLVASTAVGYDPAYVEIGFDPLVPSIYRQAGVPVTIFGNSGSAMWSIGIAAALLGDTLQTDMCMTGAIEQDSTIGPVGKVDQKIHGCAKDRYREMLIPYGQRDAEVIRQAFSLGVTVTEVRTLAEAYEAITGQPIRLRR